MEYDQLAIQAARQNAGARGITNGEFVAAKVEEALPGLLATIFRRKNGGDPGSAAAKAAGHSPPWNCSAKPEPAQVIYVSCHPATMARDLNILCGDGVFELAGVYNRWTCSPQTQHVECVADLRRRN